MSLSGKEDSIFWSGENFKVHSPLGRIFRKPACCHLHNMLPFCDIFFLQEENVLAEGLIKMILFSQKKGHCLLKVYACMLHISSLLFFS